MPTPRPLTLYVARHGETKDNVAKIITAQANSPLAERGMSQARNLGRLARRMVPSLDPTRSFPALCTAPARRWSRREAPPGSRFRSMRRIPG